MCCISKPANVNGSICQKKHLADDLLGQKTFPSIIFYEDGLQTQHAKCGRSRFLCIRVKWEGVKISPDLTSRLFCRVPRRTTKFGMASILKKNALFQKSTFISTFP
jgi:hypothetical protein